MYGFYTVRIETADGISSAHVRKVRSIESDPIDLEPENSKHSMRGEITLQDRIATFPSNSAQAKVCINPENRLRSTDWCGS